jgi:tRNA dimethylallyltransferase
VTPGAPVWLLAGATASGKSATALALARSTGAEIVNADSMQLYADLLLLTARPSRADEELASHHLFGVADAGEAWSVGRWLEAALETLAEIAARGRPAVVVGGTGLYFRALTSGLAAMPPVPAAVRSAVLADYVALGETAFRQRLARVDPAAAARIAAGDRQRLTRAQEVFEASGRALSDWQAATKPALAREAWRGVVLSVPRAQLYRRIDVRLEAMLAAGALDEVRKLLARRLDPALPAMKALGVASFARQLAGEASPAEALAEAQTETRRYAKRQITWFDRQCPDWPRVASGATVQEVLEQLTRSG